MQLQLPLARELFKVAVVLKISMEKPRTISGTSVSNRPLSGRNRESHVPRGPGARRQLDGI